MRVGSDGGRGGGKSGAWWLSGGSGWFRAFWYTRGDDGVFYSRCTSNYIMFIKAHIAYEQSFNMDAMVVLNRKR